MWKENNNKSFRKGNYNKKVRLCENLTNNLYVGRHIFKLYFYYITPFHKKSNRKGGHIMTYQKLEKLIEKYGANTTFGEVIAKEKSSR